MTLQRPIKHLLCNIAVCVCVCVGSGAGYSVLFPSCFRAPFYFFSSSIRGLQGRKPAGCWRADQPTDADLLNLRRHSQTPVSRPALWQPFPLGKAIAFFPSAPQPALPPLLFVASAWALRRGKTKTERADRRLWSICRTPAVVHTWQNRWLIRANYALKARERDRSQIPRSCGAACGLMSGAITISAPLITRAQRSPFWISMARSWLGAVSHGGANRFIIFRVANFHFVRHN